MINFNMGEGDRLPVLTATLEDESGPIDLTNSTVTFNARKAGAATLVTGACALVNQVTSPGGVTYTWGATDTQIPGKWFVQFQITNNGKVSTVPNEGSDELWINQFWAGA